jgi:hypothetical protein
MKKATSKKAVAKKSKAKNRAPQKFNADRRLGKIRTRRNRRILRLERKAKSMITLLSKIEAEQKGFLTALPKEGKADKRFAKSVNGTNAIIAKANLAVKGILGMAADMRKQ